ncbi:MAG: zinc ABC transporter substrate-binding protein [Acidobacteria bacterium]|nr:zinc ABC transporter substrate-binding protein [Acidobacteriota bacterium]
MRAGGLPALVPALLSLLALAAPSCARAPEDRGGLLRVVTTVSPVTNIVQNVGGDRIRLDGIIPEGADSHTFEPNPSDARVLAEADVVFLNGLRLEEPTLRLAESNVRRGVEVVSLGERTIAPADYIYDFSFPRAAGDPNPHLWTNPLHGKRYAEIVRDTLAKLDPKGASYYRANEDAFASRIDLLDRAVRAATATVPPEKRKLLTYHDSFPYFAREYGWTVIGAIQPSDFSEPTPREVAALVAQIKAERVPAIFGSEVYPSPVLAEIARETGARYVSKLRDDDLPGAPGDPDHSYLGLIVFDYRTFMRALGGDVSAFDAVDLGNIAGDRTARYRE